MRRIGITVDGALLHATLVFDLRALDAEAVVVSDAELDHRWAQGSPMLEKLLDALGTGSGPAKPDLLRGALALQAHWRRGGEVFVTDDLVVFGPDGSRRRKRLEEIAGTPILSAEQFRRWAGVDVGERRAA